MATRRTESLARRVATLHARLAELYGVVECPLSFGSPFQLLVAAMLSAQCTDARVNQIVPELFRRFPDAAAFAALEPGELEPWIKSAGLYHNKARGIVGAARAVMADFGGELPSSMEALTSLPGVGRKTANVVQAHAFGMAGFAVDTHVRRLLNRIGIVASQDPGKIEAAARGLLAPELLSSFSLLLIWHGRRRCQARKPDCPGCEIRDLCEKGVANA